MRASLVLSVGLLLAACSPTASAPPSSTSVPSPVPTTAPASLAAATTTPSAPASSTIAPSAAPSTAAPAASFAACVLPTWRGTLPSGRLVDISVRSSAAVDEVVFKFEPGGENPGTPTGTVATARPPFTQSGSGATIPVAGDQFLQVRLQNMTLEDMAGPVYKGKFDFKPGFEALRQVVNYDQFEGYSGWIVGMRQPTCVTVLNDLAGLTLTLRIAHP